MKKPKLTERRSGILLPLASLPSSPFNGDLGSVSYQFIDFLKASGQSWWQLLPINPIGKGNSPYSSVSSFAGEPIYCDLDWLCKEGLLKKSQLPSPKKNSKSSKVQYASASRERLKSLKLSFDAFQSAKPTQLHRSFRAFKTKNRAWLDDYAMFAAIAETKGPFWHKWPKDLRNRNPKVLIETTASLHEKVEFHSFVQFVFDRQWRAMKQYANNSGIGLIGDMPIFVAHGSSDVWANQELFFLNQDKTLKYVAGVPPDYFNADGQLWGNAVYDWKRCEAEGFRWWIARLKRQLELYDVLRLDHFIGFYRYWEIKGNAKHARDGRWKKVPGQALFDKLLAEVGPGQIIAEDLGLITKEILALRDEFEFPGMRVMQFGFGRNHKDASYHMPHNYPANSVAYTGTHDNNTLGGWYQDILRDDRRKKPSYNLDKALGYLGHSKDEVIRNSIAAVMASPANTAIIPLQDAMGLPGTSRINVPGIETGQWSWRLPKLPADKTLRHLAEIALGSERIASTKLG